MPTLYLIRGLPGSGKSTLAKMITVATGGYHFEADDFFTNSTGHYEYDPSKIRDAHNDCQARVWNAMAHRRENIIVANTFVRRWELAIYYEKAACHGYTVQEIVCCGSFKNIHNVPQAVIDRMQKNWEWED